MFNTFKFQKFSPTPELELFANFELAHAMDLAPKGATALATITRTKDTDPSGDDKSSYYCTVTIKAMKAHLKFQAVASAHEAKQALMHSLATVCEQIRAWEATHSGLEEEEAC